MNSKLAKKIRKAMKHRVVMDLDFMQSLPFRDRIRIAWNIVFGKRNQQIVRRQKAANHG